MSTTNNTPTVSTLEASLKQAEKNSKATKLQETKVTHDEQHAAIVLHNDTLSVIGKMFTAQSDFENESKFQRVAMHTAVLAWAKQECRRVINAWENEITKFNKLHPTMTREQVQDELLASKKQRETYSYVEVCISLLKDEFKS